MRKRTVLAVLALLVAAFPAIAVSRAAPAGAAAATPACTFNGQSLALVLNAKNGDKVALQCTGLSPLHPYLVMETSLLLGIDPKAQALLSGNVVSVQGLLAAIAALPEINPQALTFPVSDLSGNLTEDYTLPTSSAADPNAVCPPTTQQINSGLIGCGLAMIDLTTFKTVGVGSAVIEYAGDPVFPPNPTMVLSTHKAVPGQTVQVGDAPGATTYWWLSTLSALGALLGGGAGPAPTVTVELNGAKHAETPLANTVSVTPAVYNEPTLTPPILSGGFSLPAAATGSSVTITYSATLLAFPLTNSAKAKLKVKTAG